MALSPRETEAAFRGSWPSPATGVLGDLGRDPPLPLPRPDRAGDRRHRRAALAVAARPGQSPARPHRRRDLAGLHARRPVPGLGQQRQNRADLGRCDPEAGRRPGRVAQPRSTRSRSSTEGGGWSPAATMASSGSTTSPIRPSPDFITQAAASPERAASTRPPTAVILTSPSAPITAGSSSGPRGARLIRFDAATLGSADFPPT